MRARFCIALLALALAGALPARAQAPAPAAAAAPTAAPATVGSAAPAVEEPCEDEDARRKGVQKREFLKRLRVDVSLWGGFVAADLTSTSYAFGGALAWWLTEDLGVEASLVVTHVDLRIERPLSDLFGGATFTPGLAYTIVGNFLWSPIHLKVRATDHAILHGDVVFALGAGDTINDSVQGATFDVGIGLKLYPTRWLAIRFDLRDYLMVQEAVGVQRIVNNVVGLAGVSFFLPPWNLAVKK
jgi:outer membrane beta-barrel protein